MQHLEKVSLGLLLCCYCWATGGTGRGRPLCERQISLHQRLACIFPAVSLLYVSSLTLSGHAALRKCPLGCCGRAALDSEGAPGLRALTPSPPPLSWSKRWWEMWVRMAFEGLWLSLRIRKAVGWHGKCPEMIGPCPTLLVILLVHEPEFKAINSAAFFRFLVKFKLFIFVLEWHPSAAGCPLFFSHPQQTCQ